MKPIRLLAEPLDNVTNVCERLRLSAVKEPEYLGVRTTQLQFVHYLSAAERMNFGPLSL